MIFFSEKYNISLIKIYNSFIIIFFLFLCLSMNCFNNLSLIMICNWFLNERISNDLIWMILLKRMIDKKLKMIIEFIIYIKINYSIFSLRWLLFLISIKIIIIDFLFLYLRFRDYNWYNILLNIEFVLYSFNMRWINRWWNRELIYEKNFSWELNIRDQEMIYWMI